MSAAFVARLLARHLVAGSNSGGYYIFFMIARTFAHGGGFCEAPGRACAVRVPGYPLFLSWFMRPDGPGPGVVVAQAALGAALVWITWRIALELFDRSTGLVAAAGVAFSPYAVIHDTALQDTVLFDALLACGILMLLTLERTGRARWALAGGAALGAAVLVTARLALIVPVVLIWACWRAGQSWRRRATHATLIALPMIGLIGGWLVRNDRVVGAPVLTTVAGESLWTANNAVTLNRFPAASIDLTKHDAYAALTADERQALARLGGNEVAVDRLLETWGYAFIAGHPVRTAEYALVKVAVPLLAYLSPARRPLVQALFAAAYLPVHVMAAVAFWRCRAAWSSHILPAAVVAAFIATTAAFWAHTSHAVCLDPLWFVYAASVVTRAPSTTNRGVTI
jgi:dolichyl-phosphate-mannose-protein mannosyltransferase